MAIREAELLTLLVPAICAILAGVLIVVIGGWTLARRRGVSAVDGMATAGLFGAVSASTLAAGMATLQGQGIAYEGFIGALYPFMDIAALVTAIVLARVSLARRTVVAGGETAAMALGSPSLHGPVRSEMGGMLREILADTFRSPAISALVLGLALGLLARPDKVFDSLYDPLFPGLLSILMFVMGVEAWQRLSELRAVAHSFILYGLLAPLLHGLLGFGLGMIAHELTGFSMGGVILLAVMAASSSDISGPPTLRGALPEANPSAYVGTSTGLGTPVAILSIPLWVTLAQAVIGG